MVKAQVEGFKCVRGRRGRPGDAKATGDSKDQLGIIHAYKCQMALIAVYGTLLLEERRWYIIYDIVFSNCLFMVDWFPCWFPGSYEEHQTFNKFVKKKKTSTIIGATWRLFFVCSSCLFTFSLSRALAYLAMHNSVTGSIIYPFRRRSLKTCCM